MGFPPGPSKALPKRKSSGRTRESEALHHSTEPSTSGAEPVGGVLTGWKAIAAHFGVQPRTAQRWASLYGLPVHRYPGEKGRVYALAGELDRWRLPRQASEAEAALTARLRFLPVWAAAGLALALAAAWLGYRQLAPVYAVPQETRVEGNELVVMDAAKRELFRHSFPVSPSMEIMYDGRLGHLTEDLDGDGRREFLFRYHPTPRPSISGRLICFSSTGEVKWQFTPGRQVPFDNGKLSTSLYTVANFLVLSGSRRILVSGINSPNWPCQVVLLSADGRLLGEYWHPGHLTHMVATDLNGDGTEEALLGGVNNLREAATLVMLDLDRLQRSPRGQTHDPLNLPAPPPGAVKKVLLFGKSCLCRKFEPFNRVTALAATPDGLRVHVAEGPALTDPAVIYQLDRDLGVTRVTPSTQFLSRHQTLASEGKLDHRFTAQELAPLRQLTMLPGS